MSTTVKPAAVHSIPTTLKSGSILGLEVHRHRRAGMLEPLGDQLERRVGLALAVVVLHVVEAGELALGHDGEALRALVLVRDAGEEREYVRLAVLFGASAPAHLLLLLLVLAAPGYPARPPWSGSVFLGDGEWSERAIAENKTHLFLRLSQGLVRPNELLLVLGVRDLEHGDAVDAVRHFSAESVNCLSLCLARPYSSVSQVPYQCPSKNGHK